MASKHKPKSSVIPPSKKRKLMQLLDHAQKASKELELSIKRHRRLLESVRITHY